MTTPYHPIRKYSVRPNRFRLAPDHPLSDGCVFAGMGGHAGSYHYQDSSVHGSHGTLTNMDTSDWETWRGRRAIHPKGINEQHINAPFSENVPLTMAAWMYFKDVDGQLGLSINRSTSTGDQFFIGQRSAGNGIGGWCRSGGGFIGSWTTNGTGWYHVAAIFASSSDRTVYVNGVEAEFSDATPVNVNTTNRLWIGGLGDSTPNFSDVIVADAVVWNRAISLAEVLIPLEPDNIMLGGWIQPLPTQTYTFGGEVTPPTEIVTDIFESAIIGV